MVTWKPNTHSTQDSTAGFTKGQRSRVEKLSRTARRSAKVTNAKNTKAAKKTPKQK